ncbi:uncharacterized protein FTOL_13864 [Fusarium torulosum]|uniref:Uncharacterized protein n=1 Tax=Fusarium torulosum TaxID=33205 RepID=A0AAE8SQM9_9HYPO|nr:uncharacterized protein FTOL_13864 [Fusarium torulosum]
MDSVDAGLPLKPAYPVAAPDASHLQNDQV